MPVNQTTQRWLILVKHAMPEIDTEKPAREWQLSAAGRLAARRLAHDLSADRRFNLTHIYASPELKAQETAEILGETLRLRIDVHTDLHEHERSVVQWQNKTDFQASAAAFFANPHEVVFGSESADHAYARFGGAVDAICARESGDVCIVAHGTVISLLAARRCGVDGFDLWKRLGLPSVLTLRLPEYQLENIIEELE